jgi:preprotein translocase subunit SecG
MANEAVCIETPTRFARVIVANATGLPIGTLMERDAGTNLASASSADNDFFGGILWEEKTANDGITEVTVALDGVWNIVCTAAAVVNGKLVNLAGANVVDAAVDADFENGSIVGRAEQSSAGSEAIRVRLMGF